MKKILYSTERLTENSLGLQGEKTHLLLLVLSLQRHKMEPLKIPNVLLYIDFFTAHSWLLQGGSAQRIPAERKMYVKEVLTSFSSKSYRTILFGL